ncbi:thimet oligopeptidase [Ixodes scapularis]
MFKTVRIPTTLIRLRQHSTVVLKARLCTQILPAPSLSVSSYVRRSFCSAISVTLPSAKRTATMEPNKTTAPGILRAWDYDLEPKELLARATRLIEDCRALCDKIGALEGDQITFDNVLGELAEVERLSTNEKLYLELAMYVSTNKELRDASSEASRMLDEFEVECGMRPDIFEKLQALEKMDTSSLSAEMKRFLEKLIRLRKRDGLHLSPEVQKQVKDLKNEINELSLKFSKAINEENAVLEFTEEELKGLPEEFVKNLDTAESGKRRVTLKYPHVIPIMKMAVNAETRRRVNFAFDNRCVEENTPLLEKAICLKHKKAKLLDYETHADFITEILMARNSGNVRRFLTELAEKLQPLWQKEKQLLLQYKKEECESQGIPFDGKLNAWDLSYYKNLVEERVYKVDQEKLRAFFPLDVVTKGLLGIYETLLGLKFDKVEDVKLWHPEAELFKVTDVASQELLGYFLMDLFPREGKYSHFCNIPMQPGCRTADGSRQLAVVSVLCNFPKPTADKPSLLTHNEVTTFFHEFGHTMHHICSRANLVEFEGTRVERDFVECPSQMLENWCWDLEALRLMSGHYSTGEPIPEDLAKKLMASRLANVAQFNLRQVSLALFDLELHSRPEADTRKVFREIQESLLGYPPQEGTNFAASFGHLMGGYDARYYGYMWSEVYSMDMFDARFKKEGILNPKTGMDYREKILCPGGSLDGEVMLRNFLGREPSTEAFLISKGLSTAVPAS